MKKVEHFYELEVYEYAQLLARDIFILTKTFPKEERYSLTDQMRRSSRSVGAHVAEGWGLRRYENHFVANSLAQMQSDLRLNTGSKLHELVLILPSKKHANSNNDVHQLETCLTQ